MINFQLPKNELNLLEIINSNGKCYRARTEDDKNLAKRLEKKYLVYVISSDGLSGEPDFTTVHMSDKGKKYLKINKK